MSNVPSPTPMMTMQSPMSKDVRQKFFNSIGIETRSVPKDMATNSMALRGDWKHPRAQGVQVFQEQLKYDKRADQYYSSKQRKTSTNGQQRRKKSLSFNESVNVVPIPMRTEYSNRLKARLWSSAHEISENAARNAIEFASEG